MITANICFQCQFTYVERLESIFLFRCLSAVSICTYDIQYHGDVGSYSCILMVHNVILWKDDVYSDYTTSVPFFFCFRIGVPSDEIAECSGTSKARYDVIWRSWSGSMPTKILEHSSVHTGPSQHVLDRAIPKHLLTQLQ